MKTMVAVSAETVELHRPEVVAAEPSRLADYVELTKPRIAVLVLCTVAIGYCLATSGAPDWLMLFHVVLGTGLVAAGASALNQLLERHTDALMQRTENRPLPAGRLQPFEVLLFGVVLASAGLIYLAVSVGSLLCVAVAAMTCISYVGIYTPLKKVTTLNTLVGAVPGALPPIIGWTAARDTFTHDAAIVFLILFLWQVPHFLAIAWICREDYARAGLKMLPVRDATGRITGRQMVLYCICLGLVGLLPATMGKTGIVYLLGSLFLSGLFLYSAVRFCRDTSVPRARLVLRMSLLYLPLILLLLLASQLTGI